MYEKLKQHKETQLKIIHDYAEKSAFQLRLKNKNILIPYSVIFKSTDNFIKQSKPFNTARVKPLWIEQDSLIWGSYQQLN